MTIEQASKGTRLLAQVSDPYPNAVQARTSQDALVARAYAEMDAS
jgi:hypothetical protein